MTATADAAVHRFSELAGVTEHPHGSNHVPGITNFLHTRSGATTGDGAWCCMTVSRVLFDVGIHDLCDAAAFGGWVNGCAYVPYVTRHFRGTKRWIHPGQERRGDLEIFVWGGAGSDPDGDHIGMCFEDGEGGGSWEGNASGPHGYDEVAQHRRRYQFTLGFVRPSYGEHQKHAPHRPPHPVVPAPVANEPHYRGALFLTSPHLLAAQRVTIWQNQMHKRGWGATIGRIDGVYGPKCAHTAGLFQADCNHHHWDVGAVDHIVGPNTWHATWARPIS